MNSIRWKNSVRLGRASLVVVAAVVCVAGLAMFCRAATGLDEDGDGMDDGFERLFGLTVGIDDSVGDPDSDGKSNISESVAGTDPFNADSDLDGWSDGVDENPLSRAVYLWGEPRFTFGCTNVYTRPVWALPGIADGGSSYTGGLYAYGWSLDSAGNRLLMPVDRSFISNDLCIAVAAPDQPVSGFTVSLLDSNLVAVAPPIGFGASVAPWMTNRLPLSVWPEASMVSIQATQGVSLVVASVLYQDSDGDGLDDDQNAQLAAANSVTNSGDGVSGICGLTNGPGVFEERIGFEVSEGYAVGNLDGQMGWGGSDGVTVSQDAAFEGSQSLVLLRCGPGEVTSRVAVKPVAAGLSNSVVWVSLRQMCVPNGPRLAREQIGAAAFVVDAEGRVVAFDGASGQWVASSRSFPSATGSWVRVDFCLDYSAKTYSLCFQGVAVHRGLGFADTSLEGPNRLYLRNDSAFEGADARADNIVFSTVEPAGLDFDGDGLSNAREREIGTDVWSADSDGDGLSDAAELELGFNPLQNNTDYDGDGISNEEELELGTSPAATDSDSDGVSDLWLAATADGTSASHISGSWAVSGNVLVGVGKECMRAEYEMVAPASGLYRLALNVSNWTNTLSQFRFQLLIDGLPFRWVEADVGGEPRTLLFDTPWLVAGTHTFRIAWLDTSYSGKLLGVRSLSLFGFDAPDADGDGIQDWMIARLAASAADADGDGLMDFDEVVLNADPLCADSDADSLWDGEEVAVFGTNPLSEDSDSDGIYDTTVIGSRTGADTSFRRAFHITASWTESDGELSSQTGNAECAYDFDVPTNGGYRFGVTLRNGPKDPPDDYVYQVAVTVDGFVAGTAYVRADCDRDGTGWVTIPWVQAGTRRFGLRWKNDSALAARPTSIVIEGVELRSVDAPDRDGDGVQDWIEKMLESKGDSDGDGLSDSNEVLLYRTNPFCRDTDGDGLSDGREVGTYKTNPLTFDTDFDGVSDGEEAAALGTNPLQADLPSAFNVTVASVPGVAASVASANWYVAGTELLCPRRGYAEYKLTAPASGIYAVSVEAALSWQKLLDRGVDPVTTADLLLYVDGVYLGRVTVHSSDGVADTVRLFSPCISQGVHTVRVFYNNLNSEQRLHVRRVSLMSAPGTDADGDGIADWANGVVAGRSGLDPVTWSYVSPACLEGKTKCSGLASCSVACGGGRASVEVKAGIMGRWYADVPLDPLSPVSVSLAFESGAASASTSVEWRAFDLASGVTGIVIRAGDSLRITCAPAGHPVAAVSLSVPGVGVFQTTSDSAAVVRFEAPGVYPVTAVCQTSPEVACSAVVTVVGGAFPETSPVCVATVSRIWSVPELGGGALVESDGALSVVSAGEGQLSLKLAEPYGDHRLVMRAGVGGAVIDSSRVTGFWMQGSPESYTRVLQQCDGYGIWQSDLVAWGPPAGIEIVISTIVTGVMFDDYTLSRTVSASDFDGSGQYFFRLIHPDSATTSTCHSIKAYQDGVLIGEAWYAGTGVPEVLK